MATRDNLRQTLDEIAAATGFQAETDEGVYQRLSLQIDQVEDGLATQIRADTADAARAVVARLKANEDISAEDLRLIRLWMVSDAEFYVQMENDFPDWLSELNRLTTAIDDLRRQELTPEVMGKISGTLRDAQRVIADIVFFKHEEQRVRRFEAATQRLYAEDKQALARLLRQKLRA